VKPTVPTPPENSPKSITAAPDQSKVSISKEDGAAANPALKSTKALRQAQVKNTQEEMKAGKSSPKIVNPTTLTPVLQITQSLMEEISDLLDTLLINACVKLTRRVSQLLQPSLLGRHARGSSSKSSSL
jgi:hypothetical protein